MHTEMIKNNQISLKVSVHIDTIYNKNGMHKINMNEVIIIMKYSEYYKCTLIL